SASPSVDGLVPLDAPDDAAQLRLCKRTRERAVRRTRSVLDASARTQPRLIEHEAVAATLGLVGASDGLADAARRPRIPSVSGDEARPQLTQGARLHGSPDNAPRVLPTLPPGIPAAGVGEGLVTVERV